MPKNNPEQETSPKTAHEPERKILNRGMVDTFPIETFASSFCLHGPVDFIVAREELGPLVQAAHRYLVGDTSLNVVRLGRAQSSSYPTGLEGYVCTDPDPIQTLIDLTGCHIAYSFDSRAGANWQASLARHEKPIRRFLEKVQTHQTLSTAEVALGNTLMGIIIAKCKAYESRKAQQSQTEKRKYDMFRQTTNRYTQQARPSLQIEQSSVQWKWALNPNAVQPDLHTPPAHTAEMDQFIQEILAEICRFGNGLVREWIRQQPHVSSWR